jgi:predicted nuclease of predicted toxin-antitoxin system
MSEILRFLGDMNLSPLTVDDLSREGWDIVRVSTLLHATASDKEILELARQEARVIITQDLDFSALLALGGYDRPSLITIRLSNTKPKLVTQRLLQIFNQIEGALREGSAVTVDDTTVRIRKLPIS